MALANYADVQAAVASWLDRDDLAADIPNFIALAEVRIANRLRVSNMEVTASAPLTNGAVALPPDWIEPRRVISSGSGAHQNDLEPLSPSQAGDMFPSGAAGVPTYYSISGNVLRTYPSGGSGIVTMTYYAKPPPLSAAGTNWLLTKSPGAYLYGSLVEASPYLGDDARVQTWIGLFEQAIADLQSSDQRARYAKSVCRVRGETP